MNTDSMVGDQAPSWKPQLVKEFTIKRSKWYRGLGNRYSKLLTLEGTHGTLDTQRQCCLGQVCEQRGIPLDKLYGIGRPDRLASTHPDIRPLLEDMLVEGAAWPMHKEAIARMMTINDDMELEEGEREELLAQIAQKELGWTLTFED